LRGLGASGAILVMAGCDRSLPLAQSPLVSPPRTPRAAPLEPISPPDAPAIPIDAVFGRVVRLTGATVERDSLHSGDFLRIWLYWQSVGESQEDLRSVGQIVTDGWRVAASEDDQIGRRRRFLTRWDVGERSVDEMRIRVSPSVGPGEYDLAVSVLRPDNQTHVPITSPPPGLGIWKEDAVLVATIEVEPA